MFSDFEDFFKERLCVTSLFFSAQPLSRLGFTKYFRAYLMMNLCVEEPFSEVAFTMAMPFGKSFVLNATASPVAEAASFPSMEKTLTLVAPLTRIEVASCKKQIPLSVAILFTLPGFGYSYAPMSRFPFVASPRTSYAGTALSPVNSEESSKPASTSSASNGIVAFKITILYGNDFATAGNSGTR